MERIWIIGGGRFGLKAAQKLIQKKPGTDIAVVEQDANICNQLKKQPFKSVCMDGITYLSENLKVSDGPDWIVPAIPVHLAYEWIRNKLLERYHFEPLAVPDMLAGTLPNTVQGAGGELYISNADFICPQDCPEPYETCTYTGKPRLRILHRVLKEIQYNNFCSIVIKSWQLGRGVGGYSPEALFKALNEVILSDAFIILSTACRCHGVMHAFKISRK